MSNPEIGHDPAEIQRENFMRRVAKYSLPTQEAISTLSSGLLEPDRADQLRKDQKERDAAFKILRSTGLQDPDIAYVFDHLGIQPKQQTTNDQ